MVSDEEENIYYLSTGNSGLPNSTGNHGPTIALETLPLRHNNERDQV